MHIQRIKPALKRKIFLRESYREKGLVRKRTVADLSRWSEQSIVNLNEFLQAMRQWKKQRHPVRELASVLALYCWMGGEVMVMELIGASQLPPHSMHR